MVRRNRRIARRFAATAFGLCCLPFAFIVFATEPLYDEWKVPSWVDATAGFTGTVPLRIKSGAKQQVCYYEYPDGTSGTVEFEQREAGVFTFTIPGASKPQLGQLKLFTVPRESEKVQFAQAVPREVPLAYVEELDITGNPPVVLPYPLGDESHLVRYIPCCNIFGGTMMATRVGVNPLDNSNGVPERLASDFVIIEPDELTESTAGTHMRFTYPADLALAANESVVAYQFDWREDGWIEVRTQEINAETRTVDFLCPEGGTFVLGVKQK